MKHTTPLPENLATLSRAEIEARLVDATFRDGDAELESRLIQELERRNVAEHGSPRPFTKDD